MSEYNGYNDVFMQMACGYCGHLGFEPHNCSGLEDDEETRLVKEEEDESSWRNRNL